MVSLCRIGGTSFSEPLLEGDTRDHDTAADLPGGNLAVLHGLVCQGPGDTQSSGDFLDCVNVLTCHGFYGITALFFICGDCCFVVVNLIL